MKITRITAQSEPLRETFGEAEGLDDWIVRDMETTLAIVDALERDVDGPDLFACTSHHRVSLTQRDDYTDRTLVGFNVQCESIEIWYPLSETLVPWPIAPQHGSPHVRASTPYVVQATIMIVRALNQVFDWFSIDLPRARYVGRQPVSTVDAIPLRCPYCKWFIDQNEPADWDGERHLVCGQRFRIGH